MKKLVRNILNKSGRVLSDKKAQLSKYWYMFIPLILFGVLFFGYGVFGGESEEPESNNGYFRNSDKLGGWRYVLTDEVYTAYSVTTDLGGGKRSAIVFSAPEFVREDDELKHKTEAKSLKGYYEIGRLQDDGVHDFEYVDWNWTSVSFRVKVKDAKQLGKDIPLKHNGIVKDIVKLSSLESKSEVITLLHELGNWSFGEHSTIDGLNATDNNATFADNYVTNTGGGYNTYNYGIQIITFTGRNALNAYVGMHLLGLGDIIGSGLTIDNLTVHYKPDQTAGTPSVTYFEMPFPNDEGEYWEEGYVTGEAGIASWQYPTLASQGASNLYWTTDVGGGNTGDYNSTMKGETLATYIVPAACEPCSWDFDIELTDTTAYPASKAAIQAQYDLNGNISFGTNITTPYDDTALTFGPFSVESVGNEPIWYIEYTVPNTAPTIKNNVTTISESPTQENFDLSCTFTPLDNDEYEPETLTAYVDWYNLSDSVSAVAVQNDMVVTNDTEASFVLDSDNTTAGEFWNCSIRVGDGVYYSSWLNNSQTEITGAAANKTDFTTGIGNLQSNNVKDVYVYDASRESWNREDATADWHAVKGNFPDEVYLFLTDTGLDLAYPNGSAVWMDFVAGTNNAIDGNELTSVYALDGKIYVGSDLGLYVLDFDNDNITRYDNSNGFATFNTTTQFSFRNDGTKSYFPLDGTKQLASDVVNDVHAARVRGSHLVGIATDGNDATDGVVNIINMHDIEGIDDDTIAELVFYDAQGGQVSFDSESVFIADDGALYYSEIKEGGNKPTKLSYKYDIDSYTGTTDKADGYYLSKADLQAGSTEPYFLGDRINDIYVTSHTSRAHLYHNTVYIATENGTAVIQEIQSHEGSGTIKAYGYTGSENSDVDYKILEGGTDNVTSVAAGGDGNAMYLGTSTGNGFGSVSKISLNSNMLVDSWNSTTDTAIIGNDTTSIDFLDGDLLVGTLDSGATQIVEEELDLYLVTDYTKHRVIEIDDTGLIHWEFGVYNTAGSDSTHLNNPTDTVRLVNGNTVIADYGNKRILEVDPDGTVVKEIGNSTQLSDATYLDGVYSVKKV